MNGKSDNFEITKREILASISIIAVMILIGILISNKISENQMDKNEIYNKAVVIIEISYLDEFIVAKMKQKNKCHLRCCNFTMQMTESGDALFVICCLDSNNNERTEQCMALEVHLL